VQAQKVSDKRLSIIRESKGHFTSRKVQDNIKFTLSKCISVIFHIRECRRGGNLLDTGLNIDLACQASCPLLLVQLYSLGGGRYGTTFILNTLAGTEFKTDDYFIQN
jgi:hypothetical protein